MIKLTDAQQQIKDSIINKVNTHPGRFDCVVQGYAGTGKSTTISSIITDLDKSGFSIAVTAPTHKANQVLKSMMRERMSDTCTISTIHSFLGLQLVQDKQQQVLKHDPYSVANTRIVDVLVIDECSMIGESLYQFIIKSLHRVRRAVIFVGDKHQLPPVETEDANLNKLSPSFQHGMKYQLSEVLRQALDNPIINLATSIRTCLGIHPMKPISEYTDSGSGTIIKTTDADQFIQTYHHVLTDGDPEIDNLKLFKNVLKYKMIYYRNQDVDFNNLLIRTMIYPTIDAELHEGEPITIVDANLSCPYSVQDVIRCPKIEEYSWMGIDCWKSYNRSTGSEVLLVGPNKVKKYKAELERLVTRINLKEINPFTKKPYSWGDYYIIKEKICVVAYPYVTTYHKSQGSSYDNVWMSTKFVSSVRNFDAASRMLYTAVTRPRNFLIIGEC